MRKMATVRRIDAINPIPDADSIECAVIGGWKVVTKKGEYKPGDLAVYCEIDSWIPNELAPFLSKGEPKEYNSIKGERLRTVRLRKQLSQGLLLPYSILGRIGAEDEDVSEELNIQKWEAPVNPQLAGQVKGNFPSRIPKTDQERVQNLSKELEQYADQVFEVTEKLEGSSMTCYMIENEFGVCSRNLDLKRDENNTFWRVAIEQSIENKMRTLASDNYAIQGELIGPGIQGNIYNLNKHTFRVFDIYDIDAGEYVFPETRHQIVEALGLTHVPLIGFLAIQANMDYLLETAEGNSLLNDKQEREGLVYKAAQGQFSFKAISNKYLLKN
ncbi:MAG: RNA ligase, DRB0094 family [uncultured bacterium]|nr:MAG: RNA ligase, DRB0094 family [uncultured bacterium]